MNANSAHTRKWEIAEVVLGIPFLISLALNLFIPSGVQPGSLRQATLWGGVGLATVGLAWISLARREFKRFGQPTDPGQPTGKIVKTGVFAFSRNPLYLGGVCVFFGLALALNDLWGTGTAILSVALCQIVLIGPEERYLAARFGLEYSQYAASVHRWLGRK